MEAVSEKAKDKIRAFAAIIQNYGSGYGSGYGYGYGYGDGYGDGYGEGDGDGSGSGSGYGSGYGYGYGYGDGYGDGDGYGYGDGSGYGYGYGDGIKCFCGKEVYLIDGVKTLIDHVHRNAAKGAILNSDLTLEECYVVKAENFFAHGKTLREAMDALEEKMFEDMPVDEKIDRFIEKFQTDQEYPTKAFFDWHNRLTGSCDQGRRAFARDHDIDLENGMMTVKQFIDLTRNAFGGSVIRQLEEKLK